MSAQSCMISDRIFFAYAHPYHRNRFYLALIFAVCLFPFVVLGILISTVYIFGPILVFMAWIGSRVLFSRMVGNSILVSELNYPRVNAIAEDMKIKIGYEKNVFIFVLEEGSFNAYMSYLFFRRAIFLTSELLETGVSDDEVRWIVGRFVGYLRARRQAGVLGWIIRAAQKLLIFNLFIMPYERAMVYTGDRLALVALDGDISTAISAIQKIFVGRQLGYSVNPEGIIDQQRQIKGSIFAFLARISSGFPHLTSRYVDLMVFAKAFFPVQFARFEAGNPGLPENLSRLASSSRSSVPPPPAGLEAIGRPPFGWLCALATLGVLTAIIGLPIWFANNPSTQAAIQEPQRAPTTAAPTTIPAHVRQNERGHLEPDPGCRWASKAPDDFQVVCE